jgi:hypothetical protein
VVSGPFRDRRVKMLEINCEWHASLPEGMVMFLEYADAAP